MNNIVMTRNMECLLKGYTGKLRRILASVGKRVECRTGKNPSLTSICRSYEPVHYLLTLLTRLSCEGPIVVQSGGDGIRLCLVYNAVEPLQNRLELPRQSGIEHTRLYTRDPFWTEFKAGIIKLKGNLLTPFELSQHRES